jgi:hypothetical protein
MGLQGSDLSFGSTYRYDDDDDLFGRTTDSTQDSRCTRASLFSTGTVAYEYSTEGRPYPFIFCVSDVVGLWMMNDDGVKEPDIFSSCCCSFLEAPGSSGTIPETEYFDSRLSQLVAPNTSAFY